MPSLEKLLKSPENQHDKHHSWLDVVVSPVHVVLHPQHEQVRPQRLVQLQLGFHLITCRHLITCNFLAGIQQTLVSAMTPMTSLLNCTLQQSSVSQDQ